MFEGRLRSTIKHRDTRSPASTGLPCTVVSPHKFAKAIAVARRSPGLRSDLLSCQRFLVRSDEAATGLGDGLNHFCGRSGWLFQPTFGWPETFGPRFRFARPSTSRCAFDHMKLYSSVTTEITARSRLYDDPALTPRRSHSRWKT